MTRIYRQIGPHAVNHSLPVADPHTLITYQVSRHCRSLPSAIAAPPASTCLASGGSQR